MTKMAVHGGGLLLGSSQGLDGSSRTPCSGQTLRGCGKSKQNTALRPGTVAAAARLPLGSMG